jgi:hypothetical protein
MPLDLGAYSASISFHGGSLAFRLNLLPRNPISGYRLLAFNVEIILAQEEDVELKDDSRGKNIKKKLIGTLILTSQRLIFVEANQEDVVSAGVGPFSRRAATYRYADIQDLGEISPANPNNLEILLSAIEDASGSEGITHPPELKVAWKKEDGAQHRVVFIEELINDRKKDLKDWAKVIQGLQAGTIAIRRPTALPPGIDSLDGKILHVMGDMQEKGPFEIEEETESEFHLDLDPDDVQAACEKLTVQGFLDKTHDRSGEAFYRKRSPLGEDDLSS